MKVVADTNVLVSALTSPGGSPETFYRLAVQRRVNLVSSRPLLVELARVLVSKFGWQPDRAEQAVAQIVRIADIVEPMERISEIEADPTDNRVLEAAAEGGAEAIVSGDRHLLELGSWRGIRILGPAAFLSELGLQSR